MALFRQVLLVQRRILGPKHPDTLHSMYGLAYIYREQGKYQEAEAIFSQFFR